MIAIFEKKIDVTINTLMKLSRLLFLGEYEISVSILTNFTENFLFHIPRVWKKCHVHIKLPSWWENLIPHLVYLLKRFELIL